MLCDWVTISATRKTQYICILTQNIINEKVFLGLWFWLLFVFGLAVCGLVTRIAMLLSFGLWRERKLLALLNFKQWKTDSAPMAKKKKCLKVVEKHFLGISQAILYFFITKYVYALTYHLKMFTKKDVIKITLTYL